MNTIALKKHEIYNNLDRLDEKGLESLADFARFLVEKKHKGDDTLLKLQGIISEYNVDLSLLKKFRMKSLKHIEKKIANE